MSESSSAQPFQGYFEGEELDAVHNVMRISWVVESSCAGTRTWAKYSYNSNSLQKLTREQWIAEEFPLRGRFTGRTKGQKLSRQKSNLSLVMYGKVGPLEIASSTIFMSDVSWKPLITCWSCGANLFRQGTLPSKMMLSLTLQGNRFQV